MPEIQPLSHYINKIKEIGQYKNILNSLVQKELIGRYKNSLLGFGWHFMTPIIMMLVYYIVFTSGIRSTSMDNFLVYLSSGLFPFTFMISNLSGGAGYIVGNSSMIKKMYFPREIIVLAPVISSFIIMIIGYVIVFTVILLSGFAINPISVLFTLVIFVLIFFFTLGYTLLFSSMTVYIRDLQYFLSAILMIFMFVTPMYFTVGEVTGLMEKVVWLNPFTYYIESIHDCIYYGIIPNMHIVTVCVILSAVSFTIGLAVFRKLKHGFVERL